MSPKESIKNERVIELIKNGVKENGVRGLSRNIGMSPAIITRYVQGKVGEPSQATLEKLSAYFEVDINYLSGSGYYRTCVPTLEKAKELHKGGIQAVLKWLTEVNDALDNIGKDFVKEFGSQFANAAEAWIVRAQRIGEILENPEVALDLAPSEIEKIENLVRLYISDDIFAEKVDKLINDNQ